MLVTLEGMTISDRIVTYVTFVIISSEYILSSISFRKQNIKSYVIPSSVTSIGDWAFRGCHSLSEIVIPSSVTSIGDSAFSCCHSLSEIVIPSSVTSIGDSAFSYCCSLSEIVIPSSVTGIGDSAFYRCKFLDNLKQELIFRFGDKIF